MIWKLITLAGAAFALWTFLRRAMAVAAPPARRGAEGAEDYARCPRCGAWKPAAGDCACRVPPTP